MSQIIPQSTHALNTRDNAFMQALNEALNVSIKSKPYTAYITRHTPSVFVFLIDQSGSMSERVQLKDGSTTTKAVFTAEAINKTLNNLLDRCIKGNDIREYFEVAIIGYGNDGTKANIAWQGALSNKKWVSMNDLAKNPLAEKEVTVERSIRGKVTQITEKRKTWIEAIAKAATPMHNAFTLATELLEEWLVNHKNKDIYPPTVINITDGQFTDAKNAEMQEAAQRIKALKTMDGNVLLFNLHISTKDDASVLFPHQKSELPQSDEYASILFDMSSDLPDIYHQAVADLRQSDKYSSFTAMSYNASLDKLISLMNIGTSTTLGKIQQLPNV